MTHAFSLRPTAAGIAIDATGRVEIRARGGEHHFEVGMDAALADGASFTVRANGRPAGTMRLTSGAGNLHLRDLAHIVPAGRDPVRSVRTVEIRNSDGIVVLERRNALLATSGHVR